MATAEVYEKWKPVFERLFANPSIVEMLPPHLQPANFEQFIRYVFDCAGYATVHVADQHYPDPIGMGFDLNLHANHPRGKILARVEVRQFKPGHLLDLNSVMAFIGKLTVAGAAHGFMVTTSDFTKTAYSAAEATEGRVQLINGKRLLRYITYVGGSRVDGTYAGQSIAPPDPIAPIVLNDADAIMRTTARPSRHTRVLAVVNPKGGVAKTTSSLNIAFALAAPDLHNQRVLLLDMDGQGSTSRSLPRPLPLGTTSTDAAELPPPPDAVFLSDYFRGRAELHQTVRATRFPNLFLAPANERSDRQLYRVQLGGVARSKAELQFAEDVRQLVLLDEGKHPLPPFDWVVLDTPAGDTFYGRAALAAADYVLMPAVAEQFAVEGLDQGLKTALTIGALMGDVERWKDRILGCLITRWRQNANADAAYAVMVVKLRSENIVQFKHVIPHDDRVETAHRGAINGVPKNIFGLTRRMGAAARAYDSFVKEMLDYVNQHEADNAH
jgi:chromosome partitioning protein